VGCGRDSDCSPGYICTITRACVPA
jgi:hypothetical protein